jgi:hypothetical protein
MFAARPLQDLGILAMASCLAAIFTWIALGDEDWFGIGGALVGQAAPSRLRASPSASRLSPGLRCNRHADHLRAARRVSFTKRALTASVRPTSA